MGHLRKSLVIPPLRAASSVYSYCAELVDEMRVILHVFAAHAFSRGTFTPGYDKQEEGGKKQGPNRGPKMRVHILRIRGMSAIGSIHYRRFNCMPVYWRSLTFSYLPTIVLGLYKVYLHVMLSGREWVLRRRW